MTRCRPDGRRGRGILAAGWLMAALTSLAAGPGVFTGPTAVYEQAPPASPMEPANMAPPDLLRWICAQERVGAERSAAPVRVPFFFSAGECRDPAELRVVSWPDGAPVPFQVDDVRRAADGGVARLHLWFLTDLPAGRTQRWALTRGEPAIANTAVLRGVETDERVTFSAGGTTIAFHRTGAKAGWLATLRLQDGPELEFADGAAPAIGATVSSPVADRTIEWGDGPVFAKIKVRSAAGPTVIEQTWRLFPDGSVDLVQTLESTESARAPAAVAPVFLQGGTDASRLVLLHEPAGLVDALADFHPAYEIDLLATEGRPRGWLIVPGVLGGNSGRVELSRDRLVVHAPGEQQPALASQWRRWAQVTFVPAPLADPRSALKPAGQPLVAAVERPALALPTVLERVKDNVREMKPVGWVNQTVVRWLAGREDPFPRRRWQGEADAGHWIAAAQRAEAKVLGGEKRPLREDEKGRAAGPLDPYHATYGTTPLAAWLWREALPGPVTVSLRAQVAAWRRHLGRVDAGGWPYLDVFHRTQNMQMGPALLALADRPADPPMRAYYRDLLTAPAVSAVMLRGFRPYAGERQTRADPSDTIYQAVVDFLLRATELCAGETLGFHPVSFGRYLDAVDVNADLYHPAHPRHADDERHFARANFFRVQAHAHRWLAWGPAPFVALLQEPAEAGLVPGATEAWHYADGLVGRWKNWPDQSWLFLAGVLPPQAARGMPAPLPASARAVRVRQAGNGNRVTWTPEDGAAAWRVYRFRDGEAPVWLNSPYRENPADALETASLLDPTGRPGDRYVVHGVDSSGRESSW